MLLGSSEDHVHNLTSELFMLGSSPSHQDTEVVCRDGRRRLSRLLLGFIFDELSNCDRFCSNLNLVLLLPDHDLVELDTLVGFNKSPEMILDHQVVVKVEELENIPEDVPESSPSLEDKLEPLIADENTENVASSSNKNPRKLKKFTLQKQMDILDELRSSGGNKYRIAQKYSISRSSLQYWIKHEDKIRKVIARGKGESYTISSGVARPAHPQLEQQLAQWILSHGPQQKKVSPKEISKQALVLHAKIGEATNEKKKFTASQTWVDKFLKRNGFSDSELITYFARSETDTLDPEMTYPCHQCGKSFGCMQSLRTHISIHTGERPHVCSYCAKDFRMKKELEYHERIHTGEKPYYCNICGKTCADASNMNKHVKAHSAEDLSLVSGEASRRARFYTKMD